ncbi:MAG TPA: hypothetical protein VFM10_04960 [Terriglobales bacterium]|nr:hypothetical protein [Terriglobales bacterium]
MKKISYQLAVLLAGLASIGGELHAPPVATNPDLLPTKHSPRKGGPAHCVNSGVPAARRAAEKRRAVRARSKK